VHPLPSHRTNSHPIIATPFAIRFAHRSLSSQTLNYYAPFFAGVTELSTIPLIFVDFSKYFLFSSPIILQAIELSKPLFALLFIGIRIVMWFRTWTPMLFADVIYTLNLDQTTLRPGQVSWLERRNDIVYYVRGLENLHLIATLARPQLMILSPLPFAPLCPRQGYVLYLFLATNVLLGLMQLFWGYKIAKAVVGEMGGGEH